MLAGATLAHPVRRFAQRIGGRPGHERLRTVCRGHDPRQVAVHRGSEVVAVARSTVAPVCTPIRTRRVDDARPRFASEQRPLVHRPRRRRRRPRARRTPPRNASPAVEKTYPSCPHGVGDELVVAGERRRHVGGVLLPEPGAAFDVGEEERHLPEGRSVTGSDWHGRRASAGSRRGAPRRSPARRRRRRSARRRASRGRRRSRRAAWRPR